MNEWQNLENIEFLCGGLDIRCILFERVEAFQQNRQASNRKVQNVGKLTNRMVTADEDSTLSIDVQAV